LSQHKKNLVIASILFFIGWMTELLETYLILYGLGAQLSFLTVAFFEPIVSLLRSIAFIIPAGLGVMDAGYISSFKTFGIENAVTFAAAFILVKRAKEIFWSVIGIVLTIILGGNIIGKIHFHPKIIKESV